MSISNIYNVKENNNNKKQLMTIWNGKKCKHYPYITFSCNFPTCQHICSNDRSVWQYQSQRILSPLQKAMSSHGSLEFIIRFKFLTTKELYGFRQMKIGESHVKGCMVWAPKLPNHILAIFPKLEKTHTDEHCCAAVEYNINNCNSQ